MCAVLRLRRGVPVPTEILVLVSYVSELAVGTCCRPRLLRIAPFSLFMGDFVVCRKEPCVGAVGLLIGMCVVGVGGRAPPCTGDDANQGKRQRETELPFSCFTLSLFLFFISLFRLFPLTNFLFSLFYPERREQKE